ncbi:FAD/NAD(P)-binding protein [Microbacterium sp. W1N]|uniref:FAD/NAD(P)-binding protein n=1 Tax=Microbacterium festucae TaxID=2977531 RepID=UPI0021C24FF6|nr:FAD/NAD(P)-binding protein [Microbacterium festucae]MCT9820774.1 FAD/NAD(P)-binding protein [Microbacterium festucae]
MSGRGGAGAQAPVRLVVVGAGPRAVMLLERLLARRTPHTGALHITLVDPHPPGAGRIWRREQSPLLKLNSMARDVTVFTDETSTIDGPVRPGPSLIEWAELVRGGALPGAVIDDPGIAAELAQLRGDSFPTRRLHSCYLDWFWRTTVAAAPDGVVVRWHRGTVRGVTESADAGGRGAGGAGGTGGAGSSWADEGQRPGGAARFTVAVDDGIRLPADLVVYAVGHNGREPEGQTRELIAAAARAGLTYVPPAFTADADLSALPAGGDVIVRGMGLAAVDAIVLLAEGRGGRFSPAADGTLHYAPSGREPRLHLGSRRGVPYRSKVSSTIQGDPPAREVLTAEAIAALLARPGTIDFAVDVWPLIAQELVWGHYRELFTGHPTRVDVTWEQFRPVLRETAGDVEALRRAVAAVVPDPLDRFDVPALDRPLGDEVFADADAVHDRIRRHIGDDLVLRTQAERSTAQALFLTVLLSFMALAEIPTERWSARSRAVDLPVTWHTFFSYVASGPPAHRLEELLALARAGVVRFLGPDVTVRLDPDRGFVAASPRVPGEVTAGYLVDAWLPGSGAAVSDNLVLRELALRHGRELQVADAQFRGSLGRIDVDDSGRVRGPDGTPHDRLFAIGPFTSLTEAGAFTRPRADSLSLRQTDRIAGAVAEAVDAVAGGRAGAGAVPVGAESRAAGRSEAVPGGPVAVGAEHADAGQREAEVRHVKGLTRRGDRAQTLV